MSRICLSALLLRCEYQRLKQKIWCGRGDLNPHAFRRHPLKMVCLPIPPLPLYCINNCAWLRVFCCCSAMMRCASRLNVIVSGDILQRERRLGGAKVSRSAWLSGCVIIRHGQTVNQNSQTRRLRERFPRSRRSYWDIPRQESRCCCFRSPWRAERRESTDP